MDKSSIYVIGMMGLDQNYFYIGNRKLLIASHTPSHPKAIVFMLSGLGQTKNEYAFFYSKLARQLAKHSFATYQYDYYGCGDSDGELYEATFDLLVSDTRQLVNAFAAQYLNLPLIVLSRGVGTWITAYLDIPINQWIIWNPVSSNPAAFINKLTEGSQSELIEIADLSYNQSSLIGDLFYELIGSDWWLLRGESFSKQQLNSLLSLDPKVLQETINETNSVMLISGAAWKFYRNTTDKKIAYEKHPHLLQFHLTPDGQEWAIEQIRKFIFIGQ